MGVLPKYLIFTMISVYSWINKDKRFLELILSVHRLRYTDMCISSCKPRKCVALLGLLKYHTNAWERKNSCDVVGSCSKEAAKGARMEDSVLHIGCERGVECLSPPRLSTNMWYLFTHTQRETRQLLSVKTAELQRWDMSRSSLLCFSLLSCIFVSRSFTEHSLSLCKQQWLEGWVATKFPKLFSIGYAAIIDCFNIYYQNAHFVLLLKAECRTLS